MGVGWFTKGQCFSEEFYCLIYILKISPFVKSSEDCSSQIVKEATMIGMRLGQCLPVECYALIYIPRIPLVLKPCQDCIGQIAERAATIREVVHEGSELLCGVLWPH